MVVDLVIFDCDGVLIDSEILVCRLVGEEFTRLGYRMTTEEVARRFAGRAEPEMIAAIEKDWGRPVPPEYFANIKPRVLDAYACELRAMPHVADALDTLGFRRCVASSSRPDKLRLGLQTTGLYDKLAPDVISASVVARGKPAPDVFIYAAGWMRTPVTDCLVVEDSLPGVRAARAAGMRVIGFTGGRHCPAGHADAMLQEGCVRTFSDFRDLRGLIEELDTDAPDATRPREMAKAER